MIQKLLGHSCVLTQNNINFFKNTNSSNSNIFEIAYGSSYYV